MYDNDMIMGLKQEKIKFKPRIKLNHNMYMVTRGGVLAEKLGRGVRPASQNPYPIYDQNLRFSLPYL